MHRSYWEMEVHAREMQERSLLEAAKARQVKAAQCRGDVNRQVLWFSILRFVAFAHSVMSPQRTAARDAEDHVKKPTLPGTGLHALPVMPPPENRVAHSSYLSQPYAGMAILARGAGAPTTDQPCRVGDC